MDRSTLRIALRTLGRHKGFTVVAVLSIAVAIALNTVMYSVLDAMLAPRIAAHQPEHIYTLEYYGNGIWARQIDPRLFEDALTHGTNGNAEAFTGVGWWTYPTHSSRPLVEAGSRYKRLSPRTVQWNYFEFLGSPAIQGRTFRASDEGEGTPVAVISDRLALDLFPDVTSVGQTMTIDGIGFTVIGVVERSPLFQPLSQDFWTLRGPKSPPIRPTMVRMKEIVPDHLLGEYLKPAATRLAQSFSEPSQWVAFRGKRVFNGQVPVGPFYWAMIFAVVAVLMVACANLANLQLARGLARTRELALRSAVGASRAQLIRLLVLESGILAVVGLALGVTLTLWGMKLVDATVPEAVSALVIKPQASWRVFAFASGAAIVCLFLIGLLPALTVSRVDPNEMLKSGSGTGANKQHRRRYGLMVVAQIGFALPVLIAAIVVLRETWRLTSPDYSRNIYGYDARQILAANVPFAIKPGTEYSVRAATIAAELTVRARSAQGVVDAAAFTFDQPIGRMVSVDGSDGQVREEMAHQWSYRKVTPNYLRTIGLRISAGRDFVDGEMDGTGVILDWSSAKFLWPNDNPIGRSIKFGTIKSKAPWHRVIGIVRPPMDREGMAQLDFTIGFRMAGAYRVLTPADSIVVGNRFANISMLARARGSAELAAVRLQRALRSVGGVSTPAAVPLTDEINLSARLARQSFVGSLFSTFALIGLSLVAIGVYGIVSHSVAERKRELAVRISLGASARDILRSVLREGNALILGGVAVGLLLTKYTVFWLSGFIGGNDPYHAALFAGIATVLFAIAAFAAFIPALRATRIDPVEALRHE